MYGLKLYDTVYLATLVDLPCIIEAMKTLDFTNFFKSQDASQMLYVHSKKITEYTEKSAEEIKRVVDEFDPIKDDPGFSENLFQRKKLLEMHKHHKEEIAKKDGAEQQDAPMKDEEGARQEDADELELFAVDQDEKEGPSKSEGAAGNAEGTGKLEEAKQNDSSINKINLEDELPAGAADAKKIHDKAEAQKGEYPFANQTLQFRHGLSPIAQNVRNIRYKRKPEFDTEKVRRVEGILKDLIDYCFAEHVDEQLLWFDKDGNLYKTEDGNAGRANKPGRDITNPSGSAPLSNASVALSDDSSSFADEQQSVLDRTHKSEFTSEKGGFNKAESVHLDSASLSNFRHDVQSSVQKHSNFDNNIVASLNIPITANISESHSQIGAANEPSDARMMPPPDSKQTSPNKNPRSEIALTPSRASESGALDQINLGRVPATVLQVQLADLEDQRAQAKRLLDDSKKEIIAAERRGDSTRAHDLRQESKRQQQVLERLKQSISEAKKQLQKQ